MSITYRPCKDINDYEKIRTFLEESYEFYGTRFDDNLSLFEFQTALSRGMAEPVKSIDDALKNVLLWFHGENVVGLLEEDAFCAAPGYRHIFKEMVEAGERHAACSGSREWEVYDNDADFEDVLLNKGYLKSEEYWVRREFDLTDSKSLQVILPHGFFIKTVPELVDAQKVYKAYKLCYGIEFNEKIFKKMYETSTYRPQLDLVVLDNENEVAALCSGRYEKKNKLVTIEAVSCFHQYRKKGISKALLAHLLNTAKELGVSKATVYTAMPEKYPAPNRLYESAGFQLVGNRFVWKKGND
ncbi:GNAT family N-acetyltransferase [Rossellomorea vietnamensis]|uniref:GNAT family N-acetyltransferase n=1 Tax=Rossellomorea vietnamensis TaxID=218284 RepID=A0A5D4KDB7_9BACI|nr:GNAT family N-acetyltransferase [Rossellomorea vietnamensis]TYR74153.1 GNAT family N-acetyltransferase [Rossellomorea vietnamensis]